jgi:hypothetical protein
MSARERFGERLASLARKPIDLAGRIFGQPGAAPESSSVVPFRPVPPRRPVLRVPEFLVGQDEIVDAAECRSVRAHALRSYWSSIRGEREMPRRSDINPVRLMSLLPYVHISEWHRDKGDVKFRAAGTELITVSRQEYRGRWLSSMTVKPTHHEQIIALYTQTADARKPIFGRTYSSNVRHGVSYFEWLLCPLSEDGETVTHFLGLEDYLAQRHLPPVDRAANG